MQVISDPAHSGFVELFVLDLELAFSCSDLNLMLIDDRGKPHYIVSIIIKLFEFEQSYYSTEQ